MSELSGRQADFPILAYSQIVGQPDLKLALELTYLAPRIGGVLLSGERGTAKSTAVRAFALMMYDNKLPVTLPINATEDRVVGGWKIRALMKGETRPQKGLLERANGKLLYIDEVNLLDDHLVNLILDVSSTGVLVVQREHRSLQKAVSFVLVGTMNPEEGGLRPQLLDRFGLTVTVKAEEKEENRLKILRTVLDFDDALRNEGGCSFLKEGWAEDQTIREKLVDAKRRCPGVFLPDTVLAACLKLTRDLNAQGHRGDYVLALAARARAARRQAREVEPEDVREVAPLALQHRLPESSRSDQAGWGIEQREILDRILPP